MQEFLAELETTQMAKSFKMVLLEAFQELGGWLKAPALDALATRSGRVLMRRPALRDDLPTRFESAEALEGADWRRVLAGNPVAAWIGEHRNVLHPVLPHRAGLLHANLEHRAELAE